MSRLATITDSLAELAELIEAASYALDHLDVLPDARRRLMRATETALPLVRWLVDAAEDDAEAALFEEMGDDDGDEGGAQ
jgi:hypothetical protein